MSWWEAARPRARRASTPPRPGHHGGLFGLPQHALNAKACACLALRHARLLTQACHFGG
eukprot:CAMPEP_0176283564 /NCGR_PEP_ID=MMETSP0121_2-20121125/51379_1 /TAXON_ID=160619 /ORGANISM="Kryptoperidinium foliaceum, Strain CCMP 1326" /LENGTH=58 /DNA_ID=CAMNT_0017623941 /DNA_START=168 /DNA_END=341 /DNA_ORIENTATION=+